MNGESTREIPEGAVAIIGMAGRFPGARNPAEFWGNIRDGVETISHFSAEELEITDADSRARDSAFVASRSVLEDVDLFDAAFFGILPKDAELLDPQHRVFLEICWEAFEDAGYVPQTYPGPIGVFAGCTGNTYFLRNLCDGRQFIENFTDEYQVGNYPLFLAMYRDCLTTRVAYKFDLRGPCMTLQTACSTSLVAVCQAAQSLLTFQSDMALAGGVSITFPQKRGARYEEGGMISPDGHCRAFDAGANGTVFGSGAGVVLLKRLEDALADGDHVYAMIRSYALNNDGSAKVGYTAPSLEGQANVVGMALDLAGIPSETVGYLEAHGTGTPLGDPIEFAALTRAFRSRTGARNFCALGTAKRNVGHLDAASGVTGLINAVHALTHEIVPPAISYEAPNPRIDLEGSPFFVNTSAMPWARGATPRRAGVSSFGVGGTNAHVILEEAPEPDPVAPSSPGHLLVLSARSEVALGEAAEALASHLESRPDINLADVAHTLQVGRREFEHRLAVACLDVDGAVKALRGGDRARVAAGLARQGGPPVAFLFPGQGAQHRFMGAGLYRDDPGFRGDIDRCAVILSPLLGLDIRDVLYDRGVANDANLQDTCLAQPALFTVEYALARWWERRGVRPKGMIGHSIGEFVAACLAGVFSLEDALAMVAARGRLMQGLASGGMLAVRLSEQDVSAYLDGELSLAAINGPRLCVIAGPLEVIDRAERELEGRGVGTRRLATSHAFHSWMVDPLVGPLTELFSKYSLSPPTIPYVSCVSGTWVTSEQATSPVYWARHCRETVRFAEGIQRFDEQGEGRILLEVGPGRTLGTLARQSLSRPDAATVLTPLAGSPDGEEDTLALLHAAGSLWVRGVSLSWAGFAASARRRLSLPTYPFERRRYWIDKIPSNRIVAAEERVPVPPPSDTTRLDTLMPPPSRETQAARLRPALVDLFNELSGLGLTAESAGVSFVELGFDSLFLTQVTQAIQGRFGVKVTFRQLIDDLSTIDLLAASLGERMPMVAETVVPESARSAPVSAPVVSTMPSPAAVVASLTAPSSLMEAVVREQLQAMSQLMARQLEAIGGVGSKPVARVVEPVAAPPATVVSNGLYSPAAVSAPRRPALVATGELDLRQTRHIEDLVARYIARTSRSKGLTQAHRRTLADPRVAAGFRPQWKEMVYPLLVDKSRGSRLWDVDGNEYIDILNGYGPMLLGHAPDFVTEAIEDQLERGFEIGPQTPLAGQVADLVCELTGMDRVTFCNTGSEAVMAALRLARTVTGRSRIVLFAGSYHGNNGEVLAKSINREGMPQPVPSVPGVPPEMVATATVLEYGSPAALEYLRSQAGELAAVLVEPVQSRHPGLQPVEFLREVRRITAESGAALIFDEVVTGFRCHPGGAQALFGIKADLATYGKVVGGGMPIGLVAGAGRFMDALDGGHWGYGDDSYPETGVTFFAGTFVRHPLALASALAVLKHLKASGPALQQALSDKTARLVGELNRFLAERGLSMRIEHFASFFYIGFPADLKFGSLFYYHMREKGVHLQEGFPCYLSTAHTDSDLEFVTRAFKETIREMQEGGVLPPGPDGFRSDPPTDHASAETIEVALTPAQLEVLLSAQMGDEASCAFNESFTLRLRGPLDRTALSVAVQSLVDRHDALRISFDSRRAMQKIHARVYIEVPTIDLSDDPSTGLDQFIREDAGRPFDLFNGPLFRAAILQFGDEDNALVATAHHIICDGWSTNLILDELGKLYEAARQGVSANLPRPERFADYVARQKRWEQTPEHSEVESWWAAQYETPVPPLELPTDRPRAAIKSFRGDTVRHSIAAPVYSEIRRFGAQQGCTPFATLLAGYQILLHRLTSQADLTVGIPTAGQSLEEAPPVGHCVNFLPLRSSFAPDLTVGRALASAKGALLDAYDHQNYTYGSLVRKLGLTRDPSRLPLVEVQFNMERLGGRLNFPGLVAEVTPNPKSFVNFDLFLNVVESEAGLVLHLDYNSDLFDRETMVRWLGHFETILRGMAAGADTPAAALPLLDESGNWLILEDWNATQAEFPRNLCVHDLVSEQVSRTPEAVAIEFEGQRISYADLDIESNRLAHRLQGMGIGPDTPVAIFMDRCPEMIVAVLGVLKAGGCYVPLDPAYPAERVAAVLEDAGPPVIITQTHLAPELPSGHTHLVCVDSGREAIQRESPSAPASGVTPEHLAYRIYTSGSTGRPKGVEVPHRCVVNFLTSMAKVPGLTADDALVAVTTLSFDIAVLELFLPLTVGACVVLASREAASDGHRLLRLITESRATTLQGTPSTWRLLLEAGWDGTPGLKALCGGEALPRELADSLLPLCGELWNMYGPTETTVWSSALRVSNGEGAVPVGPPIANTTFYVLDELGQPTPIGVPGELYIGGEGVVRGYSGLPEMTAQKFVADPFRPSPGKRLYRTGDQVRYRPDGTIEFLGRLDTQVKVRGFRIEAGEVETALAQHSAVGECTVVAREFAPGDTRLVAYFLTKGEAPSAAELRSFLASKLPTYMVPSAYVPLAAFPKTPNGKVDRRALPRPEAPRPKTERTAVGMPSNPQERTLAAICAEVLKLDSVDPRESLFDLGADSLHVFQIVARANDADLQVTAKQILTLRSVSAISAELSGGPSTGRKTPRLVAVARDRYMARG